MARVGRYHAGVPIPWERPHLVKLGAVPGPAIVSRPVPEPSASSRPLLRSPPWSRLPYLTPRPLPRVAVAAHAFTLVAALSVWAYLDRNLWFFGDEWDFLTRRGLHGAYFSIWAPHNEHWSVLPILLWRAMYSLEHLSSYWPYVIPLLLAHVVVVHLVWRRCLREGADVWVATMLALLLALLGTGSENLTWAFQIGFVSSLLFGLLAMEVAEGPARPRAPRLTAPLARDVTVAALSLAALMCSTVGLATTLALGFVLLSRNGWRRAVRALGAPLGAFVTWFALAGHNGLKDTGDQLSASVLAKVPEFVSSNLSQALGHAAGWGSGGTALAVVLSGWLLWRSPSLFRAHPAVLGAAVAAVAFYVLAALGRDRISATMSPSRYAYVGAALLVPAIALLMSAAISAPGRLGAGGRPATGLVRAPASGPAVEPGPAVAVDAAARRERGAVRRAADRRQVPGLVRAVLVVLVVAATASNVVSGVRFARSRTVYVRGLENEIVTSGALLQAPAQLARAIDTYPIWASGFAAGYLTPAMLADLYRERLLPRARPALMTAGELLNDESWLDLTGRRRPMFEGRFQLLGAAGLTVSRTGSGGLGGSRGGAVRRAGGSGARPKALVGWPPGPGTCALARPYGRYLVRRFPTSLRFGLAETARSGALWVSLGPAGGLLLVYLARPWGLDGFPGGVALEGQQVRVPAGGGIWLNDSVPAHDLVVQLPAAAPAEVCALSLGAPRGPGSVV